MAEEALLTLAAVLGGPLLALDTSGAAASICRVGWRPGKVDEDYLPAASQPSEAIGKALADAAADSGVKMSALRAIVVGIGPGSFTGLRVGLAMAKGLAYAAHVPIYGVSSLALLAASQGAGTVALALEARRGEIFAAVYDVGAGGEVAAVIADELTTPESFAARLEALRPAHDAARPEPYLAAVALRLVGDVTIAGHTVVAPQPLRARLGLVIAAPRLRTKNADDLARLVPSYLKVSEAERVAGA